MGTYLHVYVFSRRLTSQSWSWPLSQFLFLVCDLVSCDLPPVPVCEFGLQLALTNPGECRPNYTCGKICICIFSTEWYWSTAFEQHGQQPLCTTFSLWKIFFGSPVDIQWFHRLERKLLLALSEYTVELRKRQTLYSWICVHWPLCLFYKSFCIWEKIYICICQDRNFWTCSTIFDLGLLYLHYFLVY